MSHARAFAFVASVPEADRLPVLQAAIESLFHVSDALEADAMGMYCGSHVAAHLSERVILRAEETLLEAIGTLRADVEAHKEAEDEADRNAVQAEARLEDKLQESPEEVRTLKEQITTLSAERDAALARVDAVKHLVESHADLVAMARRFTSAALASGVPIKHVRLVASKPRKSGAK